jgi:Protein of unknown function (DUF2924)
MNQRFSGGETAKISAGIAPLFDLKVNELKDRWRSIYGTEPPPRSSRKLLVSAIAYRMQERVIGGLKPSVRRLLERASEDAGGQRISRTRPVTRASAGTVLIRDWQCKSHHVTVARSISDRGRLATDAPLSHLATARRYDLFQKKIPALKRRALLIIV